MRFMVFDRWGGYIRDLYDIESCTRSQEINSSDELDITVHAILAKGDHILWRDGTGWHEHVVNELDQEHRGSEVMEYTCEPVVMQLRLGHIRLLVCKQVTAQEALELVLEQTTFEVGTVGDFGLKDIAFQESDIYKAVLNICGTFGCELSTTIEVGDSGVEHRKVNLLPALGSNKGQRFEYGRDMRGITKRILDDDVYTAAYGYGKQLDSTTDGVKDKLWVFVESEDPDALERWGLPDGKGGKMHSIGSYDDSDCEDTAELTAGTKAFLAEHSTPSMSYKVEGVPALQMQGVELGDVIQVVDRDFTPELRLEARVGELKQDVLTGQTTSATFGTVVSILPDVLTRLYHQVERIAPAVTSSQSQLASVENKVDNLSTQLTDGELDIGGSKLTVVDGVAYLDGKKLLVEETA